MTAVKVVDASALGALLFGEAEGKFVAVELAEWRLAAPSLLYLELASIYLKKLRRSPELAGMLEAGFAYLGTIGIEIVEIDYKDAAEILTLAESHKLSAYDASYLWLAQAMGAELVTLDRRLAAAFSSPFRN